MSSKEQNLEDFLAAVAARTPTPGGGAVAAVGAALGTSLASMVLAYSSGRKSNNEETEAVLEAVRVTLDSMQGHLLSLAGEDAAAYAAVREARALPKDTKLQAAERSRQWQEALQQAARVPLRTATLCREGLEALTGLADRANPHLVTDLGGAARFLLASAESAALNVRVNLRPLEDEPERQRLQDRLDSVLARCRNLHQGLETRVEAALSE